VSFTPADRDDIRRERDMFFSTCLTVAEGLQALPAMIAGQRLANPETFAHVRKAFGLYG
jgi:hypothetical protein